MTYSPIDLSEVSETNPCVVCRQPTRSHSIDVTVADDLDGELAPASSEEDVAARVALCHSCYDKYDGNPSRIILQTRGQ